MFINNAIHNCDGTVSLSTSTSSSLRFLIVCLRYFDGLSKFRLYFLMGASFCKSSSSNNYSSVISSSSTPSLSFAGSRL